MQGCVLCATPLCVASDEGETDTAAQQELQPDTAQQELQPETPTFSFLDTMDVDHLNEGLEPHSSSGNRICAVRTRLLVDSGACDTVSPSHTFASHVNSNDAKTLYAVNDSEIQIEGSQEASVTLPSDSLDGVWSLRTLSSSDTSEPVLAVCKALQAGLSVVFSPQGSYLTTGVIEPPGPDTHHVAHFVTDDTRFYLEVEENQTVCSQGGNYSTSQPILAPISSNRQQEREANQVSADSLDAMDDEMPFIPAHQREAEDHLYADFNPDESGYRTRKQKKLKLRLI